MKRILKTGEVARLLSVSHRTIAAWCVRDQLEEFCEKHAIPLQQLEADLELAALEEQSQ